MAKAKQAEQFCRFLQPGDTVYVTTCRKDYVGEVVEVLGPYTVLLKNASWVANSGRLSEFMRTGRASQMEIEPVGVVCAQWVDWAPWPFVLFTEAE